MRPFMRVSDFTLINVVLLLCEEKLGDLEVKTLGVRKESKDVFMVLKLTGKHPESQYKQF